LKKFKGKNITRNAYFSTKKKPNLICDKEDSKKIKQKKHD